MEKKKILNSGIQILLGAVILLAVGVWLFGTAKSNATARRDSRSEKVATTAASTVIISDLLEAPGTTEAMESVVITAQAAAKIIEINFESGMEVDAGRLLIQLDNKVELAEREQDMINLREQDRELNRLRGLQHSRIVSDKEFTAQQSRYDSAKATLTVVDEKLSRLAIRAPFAGVLGERKVSLGNLVSPGTEVATLDDISRIKVNFKIPEKYMSVVYKGLKFTATSIAYPGRVFEGVIDVVIPRVDPATRNLEILGSLPNEDKLLRPGMLLLVNVKLPDREALMISEKAIQSMGEIQYIFVVNSDSSVSRRDVKIGLRRDGKVEITAGLLPGELYVYEGVNKLANGTMIEYSGAVE